MIRGGPAGGNARDLGRTMGGSMQYEVLIVGGGVAGLSAALLLGRCGRHVLVCDDGRPRNAVARGVHGFLTRDGMPPGEFLKVARQQALAYPTVHWREGRVEDVHRLDAGFELELADGTRPRGRKLLLATGLVDELPEIPGFRRFWGRSAFVCPFCDAWEVRGQRMAVIGREPDVHAFALELYQWSHDLHVCTHGAHPLDEAQRAQLARLGIALHPAPILRLEGEGEQVARIVFEGGDRLETPVVFLTTRQHQRSPLACKLGCEFSPEGAVHVREGTCLAAQDVWIAGNASTGLQMAVVAAAEGAKAAHAINEQLVLDTIAADARESGPA